MKILPTDRPIMFLGCNGNRGIFFLEPKMNSSEAVPLWVFCKKGFLRNFAKFTGRHLR